LNWRDYFVEGGFMFVFFFSLLISAKAGDRFLLGNILIGIFWVILAVHFFGSLYLNWIIFKNRKNLSIFN
jgi:hypothetical protein